MTIPQERLRPQLRLVPRQRVLHHEFTEAARTERVRERLTQESFLRHPPIMAALPEEHYLLLDGANRVSALVAMGLDSIPAQIVDYDDPTLRLSAWHHLLHGDRPLALANILRERLPEVRLEPISIAQIPVVLGLRAVYALWVSASDRCWALKPAKIDAPQIDAPPIDAPQIDIRQRTQVLQRVIACYEGRGDIERLKLSDFSLLPKILSDPERMELMLFPTFTKDELVFLTQQGLKLPTGISRHLIPGRALGLDLPLELIADPRVPFAEKQRRFADFVAALETNNSTRFYEESVFLLHD